MPYCPHCRVSLSERVPRCPLCGAVVVQSLPDESPEPDAANHLSPVSASTSAGKASLATPGAGTVSGGCDSHAPVVLPSSVRNADRTERLSPVEVRKIAFELLCVSFGICLLMTVGIDFLAHRTLTWSRYSGLALLFTGLCTSMPLLFWGHPWRLYAVLGPALPACVFLWALFSGGIGWFLPAGLLITVIIEGAIVSAGAIIASMSRKGLNALAVALDAVAFLCAGIDAVVSIFLQRDWSLSWSLVVLMSVLPVSVLFYYLHYRVMKRANLHRIFRL